MAQPNGRRFNIKALLLAVVGLFIISCIVNFEGMKTGVMVLLVTLVFLVIAARMAGRDLLAFFRPQMRSTLRHGRPCPQCGAQSYSIRVVRKSSPGSMPLTTKKGLKTSFEDALCGLTFGLSDSVLALFGVRSAKAKHVARATCNRCGFCWTIRKGGL